MTIVFNVFVIYTLFNQFNCRVLDDSFNILVRINHNIFFPLIIGFELVLQVILIQFGKEAFKVTERGLTGQQWGICIGFSAITFALCVIFKFIPVDVPIQNWLDKRSKENDNDHDDIHNISNSKANLMNTADKEINFKNDVNDKERKLTKSKDKFK